MNRLAHETSPYLLQHAENPVDWYPWGAEAFDRARREDTPVLLSIGYAACHWCHVMAHESFEDEETARLMNELFVNIKVDREERPDIDGIYMSAVQAMTGHGGWPMTMFLTPDGVPFYGGTYFPPEDRHGLPSFRRTLRAVAAAYRERRAEVDATAAQLRELYAASRAAAQPTGTLAPALLERAFRGLVAQYDAEHGGFGGAPKFPQPMVLDFALRHWRRTGAAEGLEMVRHSFRAMARGGLYDQVGGGFHRYAVDAVWLVPHFEKMLYDNALLAHVGAHLYQATGEAEVRRVTEETVDWVAREMTSPEGGFYSSLDADSEGEEGKFYVWDEDELDVLLGADARIAKAYWGVTSGGNFEGRNILHVADDPMAVAMRFGITPAELEGVMARARTLLFAARETRVRPGRDEKVLAAWNGLMLRAVAECARVFGREDYRALALRNGEMLFRELVRDGRVLRTYRDGVTKPSGFLDDHAAVALGALALYELTFDPVWLARARRLAETMVRWFWDDATGAFYDTASDHEALITRPREVTDNAVPSGTSLAAELLLRMAELFDDAEARQRASWVLQTLAEPMARYPLAFGHLLGVTDMAVHGAVEVALLGDPQGADFRALARAAGEVYVPSLVMAGGPPDPHEEIALLSARPMIEGKATAYVCRSYTCDAPVTSAEELRQGLLAATETSHAGAPRLG
ncbi:MAG: thioredoxin domain-containing protein [Gemmatimonadaceae bacterium]|nr:thioredoxin domain-containing protein [Gemmatimonadaceae bacterium]